MTLRGFTKEDFLKVFDYNKDTGELFWKITTGRAVKGKRAGAPHNGYLRTRVETVRLYVHRVVFFLEHGEVPTQVDHIDLNKQNNKIENLRAATARQNCGNVAVKSWNKTGFKGVWTCPNTGAYCAQINFKGKKTYLGRFDTAEEAAAAYTKAAQEKFGEFARGTHAY